MRQLKSLVKISIETCSKVKKLELLLKLRKIVLSWSITVLVAAVGTVQKKHIKKPVDGTKLSKKPLEKEKGTSFITFHLRSVIVSLEIWISIEKIANGQSSHYFK